MSAPILRNPHSDVTPNGAHALSAFAKCDMRYYYGQVLKLSERKKSFNLLFGTAWHRAMEAYYWQLALRETDGRCWPNRPQQGDFASVEWKAEPIELATQVMMSSLGYAPEEAEEEERTRWDWGRGWAPGALQVYDQFSRQYDTTVRQVYLDTERTKPAIECYFEFELPGIPPYTGRLDRVCSRGGLPIVQEHKTSHPNYVKLLERQSRMAIQFGGYYMGYRAIFGRFPAYIELNILTKNNIPQPPLRIPIQRNIEELSYLEKLLHTIAGEIADRKALEVAGAPVHWRRTGILNGYCVDYNRSCLFLPLCKSPSLPLESYDLASMYTVGKPLQELPEDA